MNGVETGSSDRAGKKHYTVKFLYNLKVTDEIFKDLKLAKSMLPIPYEYDNEQNSLNADVGAPATLLSVQTISISDRRQCSLCGVDFLDRDQQMDHYKLDWHRFNLKRRMYCLDAVPESEFNRLMLDRSDVSSISGSDSDDDSESDFDRDACEKKSTAYEKLIAATAARSDETSNDGSLIMKRRINPKLYFCNENKNIVSLFRCLLYDKRVLPDSEAELLSRVHALIGNLSCAILLLGGGHFAAGIFDRENLIHHKTFHRYTVRAKQGSSQGVRDMKHGGHKPKSAGAALRRHNEIALITDVQSLLESWKIHLDECSVIFHRAPSFNRSILFSNKNPPFKRDDARLRNIPFATRRATQKELKRVFEALMTVEIFDDENHCPYSQVSDEDDGNVETVMSHEQDERIRSDEPAIIPDEVNEFNRQSSKSGGKRKPKKRERSPSKRRTEPEANCDDDGVAKNEELDLFNKLYTCCKVSNCKEFNSLMNVSSSQVAPNEIVGLLNKTFGRARETFLHVTSKNGSVDLVKALLHHGADPAVRDVRNQTPYIVAKDDGMKAAFTEFRMSYPEKYNYLSAKIPEKLKVRRKKVKSKLKKAETVRVVDPCTMCSSELSGKVPFECYGLKFCAPDCVKTFRTRGIKS